MEINSYMIHKLCLELIKTFITDADEKKQLERYRTVHHIFERPHPDNQLILRTIIYTKDDIQPLQRGGMKARTIIYLVPI